MPIYEFQTQWPRIQASVFVAPTAQIIGDVEIGEESSIWFGTVIRGDVFPIRIGRRSNIQDNSVIHVTAGRFSTTVGDDVTVGHRAILHGCVIEDGVLVGMGATIMDGAVIGRETLVGAGALVTEGAVMPPGMLILGAPAKPKRPLTEDEKVGMRANAAHYVMLAQSYSKAG